ncbi:MAG TPA: hypothetical protein VHE78_12865 [Gemmatimonadaceae bacterium]|nr:hypothetical protein [Gemmatimonadaceae bacterium]
MFHSVVFSSFRVPVVFGSDKNGLQFDGAVLSNFRIPPSSRYVTRVLLDHAEALLQKLDSLQSARGRVESLLMPVLPTGDVSADTIAGKLGLSR